MDQSRELKSKYKANQERVVRLLKRLGSMTLKDLEEKYLDAYEEDFPFSYIDEESEHEWLMSIPNMKFNLKTFEYSLKPQQRSKSAPFDENNNDCQQPCGTRLSRLDTRNKVAFVDCGSDHFFMQSENIALSTPINDSPEKVIMPKQSCLKNTNFSQQNEKEKQQSQGRSAQGTSKVKTVKQRGKSENRGNSKYEIANIFGVWVIGDDFPLGVVHIDLNFPEEFEKKEENEILSCGFCKSGLTIKDATEIVQGFDKLDRCALVYVGSVDIITGKSFADLQNDFNDFIKACRENRLYPILCTLAPIPTHQLGSRKAVLLDFNKFLEAVAYEFQLSIIDIHKVFSKNKKEFDEHCYAVSTRSVTGMKEWIAPWSKLGRQRFHTMIKKNLGNAMIAERFVKLEDV